MKMFFQQEVNGTVLGGAVEPDAAFRASVRVPCQLLEESVLYAACRVFAKSPALQRTVLPVSYALRLRRRRQARPVCRCMQVPPVLFALADGQAFIEYRITPSGVSVCRVWLLPTDAPAPRHAQKLVLVASDAQPAQADPAPQTVPAAQAAAAAPAAKKAAAVPARQTARRQSSAPAQRRDWGVVPLSLLLDLSADTANSPAKNFPPALNCLPLPAL